MKNAKLLLSLFLTSVLSSCASFSTNRETQAVTERPDSATCIANGDGSAECFDMRQSPPSFTIPKLKNYVCISPEDNQAQEEWIKSVKGALGK